MELDSSWQKKYKVVEKGLHEQRRRYYGGKEARIKGVVLNSTNRGDGPATRLGNAGHRRVVGGLGVEGQENMSIHAFVEHSQDGASGELNDL